MKSTDTNNKDSMKKHMFIVRVRLQSELENG